jgi:hypothetical protein
MSAQVRVLERVTRVAPFGVQFFDPLNAAFVREGLNVELYQAGQPRWRVRAQPNAEAVYVLHDAPGLGRASRGRGDDAYWAAPPESRAYRCEVTDTGGRFQPLSFGVRLPFRGLFRPDCASPPASGISLFSAQARSMPGALAVLRASLLDAVSGKPAAWALVAAECLGSEVGRGLADAEGRLLLAFPYPEPERRSRPSPPDADAGGALMGWEVGLRAFYGGLAPQAIPDYCALLAQPEARLFEGRSPPVELAPRTLHLGREFVFPSPGLFVAPA